MPIDDANQWMSEHALTSVKDNHLFQKPPTFLIDKDIDKMEETTKVVNWHLLLDKLTTVALLYLHKLITKF